MQPELVQGGLLYFLGFGSKHRYDLPISIRIKSIFFLPGVRSVLESEIVIGTNAENVYLPILFSEFWGVFVDQKFIMTHFKENNILVDF